MATRWRLALLIAAVVSIVAGGVAVALPARLVLGDGGRVTVHTLAVDASNPAVGEPVRAVATIAAKRRQTLDLLALMVRDEAGASYNFPAVEKWTVHTQRQEFVATRSFDKPGTYVYWVGFRKGAKWTDLQPRQTLTVGGEAGPVPSPTAASPSPSVSPRPAVTRPPSPPAPGSGFPNAANTGVPAGTALSTYTGSCTVTTDNAVISARTVNCDLRVQARNVVIKNSKINGSVSTADGSSSSFTLTDSTVDASPNGPRLATGVGADNFTVLRSEIIGGNRGIYCRRNCEVRDSWIHGTEVSADWHASGIRASQGSRIIHNTIHCEAQPTPQDGGCSADLTMYGDFEAVRDVLVERNLFVANPTGTGFCAYGGSSPGKPYSGGAANIVFAGNVFARGANRKCGAYGPITAFDSSRPGNRWVNNVWDDGAAVPPAN